MRKFITTLLLLLFVSVSTFGQDWAESVSKKFYSKIDPLKKLDCCDKLSGAMSIDYTHLNYEFPLQSSENLIGDYYSQVMDSATIDIIVKDMVDSYYEIPKKFRDDIVRSCFNIDTKTTIENKYNSDLYFVEGKVHFSFMFQTNKPYKRNIFKRLFGIL